VGLFVPGRRDDALVTEVRQVVRRLDGLQDPVVRRCSPMTSLALLDAERPYTDEKAAFLLGDRLRELLVALAVTLRPLYASVVLEAPFLSPKDLLVTPEPDLFLDAWFDLTRLHSGIAQAYTGAHMEQVSGGLYVSTRAPFNPARFDEPLAASLERARRAMAQVVAHG
jgi:hypothetical protein